MFTIWMTTKNEEKYAMGNGGVAPESVTEPIDNEPSPLTTDSKPLGFCKLLVERPASVLAVTFSCHVFLLLLTVVLLASGYKILPVDFGRVPLNLEDDLTKRTTDAWWYAPSSGHVATGIHNGEAGRQDMRGTTYQTLELIYESESGGIITRENLLQARKTEQELYQNSIYQEELCQLMVVKNTRMCKPPLSLLRFFDGTLKHIHANFYDPEYNNISVVLATARAMNQTRRSLDYNLAKDTVYSGNDIPVTRYFRSFFYIGWPITGYKDEQDGAKEQSEKLDTYIGSAFAETLRKKYEIGVGKMNFYYSNRALRTNAIQEQVVKDMLLAVFSLIFIMLFMWLQTGSLWITLLAIFSILSSFNITNLIYRIIFDYRYIGIFHVLSIFIILGIGADDVFVYMDTWKQSEKVNFPSMEHRLSFVYKRAAKAMFITSFTTAVAFLSNVPSPLLAISSFGLFSAILVLVNYTSIIIFFPAVVAVHEAYRKGKCCCCMLCGHNTPAAATEHGYDVNPAPTPPSPPAQCRQRRKSDFIINFFKGVFFQYVIKHKIVRFVVLAFFLAFIALSITYAAKLQPDEEQIQLWNSDTNWAKVEKLKKNKFSISDEDAVVVIAIIWGLKPQDRSSCHHTDYKCHGTTVLDTSFDMNLPPCQNAILKLCTRIKNLPESEIDRLKLRRDKVTGEIEIECFLERMQEFFEEENSQSSNFTNDGFTLPLSSANMRSFMRRQPSLYNVSKLSHDYYRYFEVGLGYFLTNGTRSNYANNPDYKKYNNYIGASYDIATSGKYNGTKVEDNRYGNRLVYMGIAMNTSLQANNLGFKYGLSIYDNWEKFVADEMNKIPPSCNKAFQTSANKFNTWHWLKVQKVLIKNAVRGIIVGILLALLVLITATTNLYIGILATFTISMVTCGVLATITLLGWKLGPLESLNMTLVVGLSVDYVVHLAEGYIVLGGGRLARTKGALANVGISVISGACTTLGSSVFMLAAKIVFFKQFGIFIFCTIGLSTLYSLVFFTTLLALIGPENNSGSLVPIARKISDLVRGKTKDHEDCQKCSGKGYHLICNNGSPTGE